MADRYRGGLYVGVSANLIARVQAHKGGAAPGTSPITTRPARQFKREGDNPTPNFNHLIADTCRQVADAG